jgi:hypothetical protein
VVKLRQKFACTLSSSSGEARASSSGTGRAGPIHGPLSNRRVFATIPEGLGFPDGAAIDSEGGYRCALHGGSKLRRFNSDGSVDHDVDLPVSQPTMCAFAGEGLATIYVTSASYKLSEVEKGKQPLAGVPRKNRYREAAICSTVNRREMDFCGRKRSSPSQLIFGDPGFATSLKDFETV